MDNLAIFDTFKVKDELTGKAKRQRKIIQILGVGSLNKYTKVKIAKKITNEKNQYWRNTYSGVYDDIENTLIPLGIIVEKGKIPLKRGPKSLQKEGTAFYELTKTGILLLYCIKKGKMELNFTEFTSDDKLGKDLNALSSVSPTLCFLLLERYAHLYCKKRMKMVPITLENLSVLHETNITYNLRLIESILSCSKEEQGMLLAFLDRLGTKH